MKIPNSAPYPIGISDEPAPVDVPAISSIPIGKSGAARYGETLSHMTAELVRLANRIALLDKIPVPWPKDF